MFVIDKAHELVKIGSNKKNNIKFKFQIHIIRSSIMVSVVDFESEYTGSSLHKDDKLF